MCVINNTQMHKLKHRCNTELSQGIWIQQHTSIGHWAPLLPQWTMIPLGATTASNHGIDYGMNFRTNWAGRDLKDHLAPAYLLPTQTHSDFMNSQTPPSVKKHHKHLKSTLWTLSKPVALLHNNLTMPWTWKGPYGNVPESRKKAFQ